MHLADAFIQSDLQVIHFLSVCVLLLLFCAVTVLFLFQKAAIHNTLISKDCLCDCCEISKLINA